METSFFLIGLSHYHRKLSLSNFFLLLHFYSIWACRICLDFACRFLLQWFGKFHYGECLVSQFHLKLCWDFWCSAWKCKCLFHFHHRIIFRSALKLQDWTCSLSLAHLAFLYLLWLYDTLCRILRCCYLYSSLFLFHRYDKERFDLGLVLI